ncbi:lipoyl(octanoyl) transferase LipB [Nakamurella sp. YIM 132087]|uniref:Octanoyltransferase n=1 Tax=Nakamurella alba TaxID=2665158 RepID=A0A7K1FHG1_9ACTN|nr:lipoyl(octanoyl) transferase LipB [Nakamurella alba]MTD13538.1 lipoyl(octanoyl) transferase LipB [Nakamurella alba]
MRDRAVPLEIIEAGDVDYPTAWDRQRELAAARADGLGPDTVLLLTHPPVYTAGKRTRPEDRPVDGTPVVEVDRGGRITWHGPGQLVGYPIVGLSDPKDVVGYVGALEQAIIAVCEDLGLTGTGRVPGRSGVWLPADGIKQERKICAIGIRVTRGVSMHGFALNCDPDLAAYDRIVPCGLTDVGVTSLSAELGRRVTVDEVLTTTARRVRQALDGELPIQDRDLHRPAVPAGVTWDLDPALAR